LEKDVSLDVHVADLLKDNGWDEAIKGCDAIIHVAGDKIKFKFILKLIIS